MLTWVLIATTAIAASLAVPAAGLSVDWASFYLPGVLCLLVIVALWFYRAVRPDRRLAACLNAVLQLLVFTAPAMALSYAVAGANRPLWDDVLLEWDRALGFDWFGYAEFVRARPWMNLALAVAYSSLIPQMFLACTALGLAGEVRQVRVYVTAFIGSGLVAVLFSAAMPSLSMFPHLHIPAGSYPTFAVHLLGLRDGTLSVISNVAPEGLITFPSYHAALAVIYTTAFWPISWLRWPALIVNLLLLAATPLHGWHYVVDVIAGVFLGIVSWRVASRAVKVDPNAGLSVRSYPARARWEGAPSTIP